MGSTSEARGSILVFPVGYFPARVTLVKFLLQLSIMRSANYRVELRLLISEDPELPGPPSQVMLMSPGLVDIVREPFGQLSRSRPPFRVKSEPREYALL